MLLTPLLVWGSANATGFCFSQGRWLSDQELIDGFVADFVRRRLPPASQIESVRQQEGDPETVAVRTVLPYQTVEQFKADNPDCCRIGLFREPKEPSPRVSWLDHLTGYAFTVITYKWSRRYLGEDGKERLVRSQSHGWVDSCGRRKSFLDSWRYVLGL